MANEIDSIEFVVGLALQIGYQTSHLTRCTNEKNIFVSTQISNYILIDLPHVALNVLAASQFLNIFGFLNSDVLYLTSIFPRTAIDKTSVLKNSPHKNRSKSSRSGRDLFANVYCITYTSVNRLIVCRLIIIEA